MTFIIIDSSEIALCVLHKCVCVHVYRETREHQVVLDLLDLLEVLDPLDLPDLLDKMEPPDFL